MPRSQPIVPSSKPHTLSLPQGSVAACPAGGAAPRRREPFGPASVSELRPEQGSVGSPQASGAAATPALAGLPEAVGQDPAGEDGLVHRGRALR